MLKKRIKDSREPMEDEASSDWIRYSPSFRADETRRVMSWIKAGQCGCLVGLQGVGKSNFFQHLMGPDVQDKYLGQAQANFVFVQISLLGLIEQSSWGIYELLLDRLFSQFHLLGATSKNAKTIIALQREVLERRDPVAAQRAIERYLDLLLKPPKRRLVLLFDEFSLMFATAEASLLRSLRAMRDRYKERLIYIVAGLNDLSLLRNDLPKVDHFYRLVNRRVCGFGPYNQTDARQMIDYLVERFSLNLPTEIRAHIAKLCGGHAGLIKTTLGLLEDESTGWILENIDQLLYNSPSIRRDCQRIWDNLPERERVAVRAVAFGASLGPELIEKLQFRGLVRKSVPTLLFSPLFREFVRKQSPTPTRGIFVDYPTRNVYREGELVATLNGLELESLYYLATHRGRLCTKDEILESIHRQPSRNGLTDQSLQALISRIRKKIEPDPAWPRYLQMVRGEGYKLVEPPPEGNEP